MSKNRPRRDEKQSNVTRVPFRFATEVDCDQVTWGTFAEVVLTPATMGPRLADIAGDWQKYRFVDLHAQVVTNIVPSATSVGQMLQVALAFDPTNTTNTGAISSLESAASLMKFSLGNGARPIGFRISRNELLSRGENLKWWETSATGAPGINFTDQGTFYLCANTYTADADLAISLVVEGVVEFTAPVDPADASVETLRIRAERALERLQVREEKVQDPAVSVRGDNESSGPVMVDFPRTPSVPLINPPSGGTPTPSAIARYAVRALAHRG